MPTLLVLAAGMGSRYGGLKQLDAVGPQGETIIDYSVYDAARAGFDKIVFVIRRDIERPFRETIGDRYTGRVPVAYAFQELAALPKGYAVPPGREKPWGTGHAILCAAKAIDQPFAVINGDDFYGRHAFETAAEHLARAKDRDGVGDYCMVGYVLRNTLSPHGAVARGICQADSQGALQTVTETLGIEADGAGARAPATDGSSRALTGNEIVSMNLWGFTPSLFDHLEAQFRAFLTEHGGELKSEFYIPSVVNQLIATGAARVQLLTSTARWFGVTYREDKAAVQESLAALVGEGAYPSPLW